jgi:hypothetical protein
MANANNGGKGTGAQARRNFPSQSSFIIFCSLPFFLGQACQCAVIAPSVSLMSLLDRRRHETVVPDPGAVIVKELRVRFR